MRARIVQVAAATAMVLTMGASPATPAQDQLIRQPAAGQVVAPRPVQSAPPARIIVPPPSEPAVFVPAATEPRRLEEAPAPQYFVAPGLEGVYAQLRRYKGTRFKAVQLRPYEPYRSPVTPPDASRFNIRQLVVKFIEGSGVRLRNGTLVVSDETAAVETRARLARTGMEPGNVAGELAKLNDVIGSFKGLTDRAAPRVDELDLLRLRQAAERNTRFEQPDPNLFYFVHLPALPPEQALRALQTLAQFRIVEVAYFQPIPFDAADKPPQTTLTVAPAQNYSRRAPLGIDADFARNFAGGRGEGVRIADIEAGWNPGHEDLPPVAFGIGVNWGGDHGTAVLGELVAEENAFGATGIAPLALAGWSSVTSLSPFRQVYFYSVGDALLSTGGVLRTGDIALVEQHFPSNVGPPPPGTCNPSQFGFVAVESVPFEHAAISWLTGAGIVVVEAAGNGEQMVVPAATRDSGAIVVGASDAARTPACFTNFGPRVDVHGWGVNVGTLSYGMELFVRRDAAGNPVLDSNGMLIRDLLPDPTLRGNGNDPDQWYTRIFSGTSSASPIVTGAAALIQSTRAAAGQPPLTSFAMRTLLASTGTPQLPHARNIGPQPNLRAAIATYFPDAARFVSQTAAPTGPVAPGASFSVTVEFQNSGGIAWTGGHVTGTSPSQTGGQPFGYLGFPLGATNAPLEPGQSAPRQFTLTAPTTPGTYSLSFLVRSPSQQVLAVSPAQTVIVATSTYDATALSVLVTPGSLPMGVPAPVTVSAQNTGTTTWNPQTHALRIWGSPNLTLSQTSGPLAGPIAPGQSQTFNFTVTCRGTGQASFSTQMMGQQGAFGAVAGRSVTCQL